MSCMRLIVLNPSTQLKNHITTNRRNASWIAPMKLHVVNVFMVTTLFVCCCFALCQNSAFGQIHEHTTQKKTPKTATNTRPSLQRQWSAIGDYNHDDHPDIAISYIDGNTVDIYCGYGNDQLMLWYSIPVDNPTHIVSGDFDNDGWADDLAIARSEVRDFIIFIETEGEYFIDTIIKVEFSPHSIAFEDFCGDNYPEWIVSGKSPADNMLYVRDMLHSYQSDLIQDWPEYYDPCNENSGGGPCNDYTEPECNPSPEFDGIWECMRAVTCRRQKCEWAACIEREDSNLWGVFKWSKYALQVEACASLALAERVLCLPAQLIPGI